MLIVEQNYAAGIPQTAVANLVTPGVGWHWSAGGRGRAGWLATIAHLIATRLEVNASYHGGFWAEHGAGHVGCRTILQWIVATTKAAHSIAPSQVFQLNPAKDRALQEARFTEVRRILGARAADPNAALIAIAYAGMPADLEADLACPIFRADVQDLARQLVAHPQVVDRPHFGHGWIQPITRYEMDVATVDFINLLYQAAAPPQEVNMPTPPLNWVPQLSRANVGGAELREQADLTAPVVGTIAAGDALFSVGEDPRRGPRWRLALAGDPERLYYVRKDQITAMEPLPRDPALYAGIAAVVNARLAGEPAPTGLSTTELAAIQDGAFEAGAIVGRGAAATAAAAAPLPARGVT